MEYDIDLNTSPKVLDRLNDLPIKTVNGAVIHVRDVAQVRDGYLPQQNIVRQDGVRSTLISILKTGSASTLTVANGVKQAMAAVLKTVSDKLVVKQFADQSIFVRAAISGVVREGVIAACLTAIMILLFLGSWRSTVIIALSIPLSILASLACLSALGETINLMTLGGLALAVGILVDDATVELENVHRQMALGKPVIQAILDGAQEIALPAFVSTLCICIVFVPMFFLTGVARYLFVPLAEAVVFAMLASYVLSRTLVPTLVMWFYRHHVYHGHVEDPAKGRAAWCARSCGCRIALRRASIGSARATAACSVSCSDASGGLCAGVSGVLRRARACSFPSWARTSSPRWTRDTFRLHVRARSGTRIEETAKLLDEVEAAIRREIPPEELHGILDNIGMPISSINLSYSDSGLVGTGDADILVSLTRGAPSHAGYVQPPARRLNREFPGATFYFLPADIVSQIHQLRPARAVRHSIGGPRPGQEPRDRRSGWRDKIRQVPGAVDVRVQQPVGPAQTRVCASIAPGRRRWAWRERDVANSVLLSLSGSGQVSPAIGSIRASASSTSSISACPSIGWIRSPRSTPCPSTPASPARGTDNCWPTSPSFDRTNGPPAISHYNVMPVIDIFGGVSGRDLGGVLRGPQAADRTGGKGACRAAARSCCAARRRRCIPASPGLGIGLVMAIVLIYLLLVVNFQSWLDPFIIITALPGRAGGRGLGAASDARPPPACPALMGAIMSLGVATANSVLVVTFARNDLHAGHGPADAAWEAGVSRLRPVLMTALAMVIGMLPMALGLGEGGEQNAPLGRAVIGGLVVATIATLFFVPVVFSLLHRHAEAPNPCGCGTTGRAWRSPNYGTYMRKVVMNSLENNKVQSPEYTAPPPSCSLHTGTRRLRRVRLSRVATVVGVLVVLGFLVGFIPRWHQRSLLRAETVELATPSVAVVSPKPSHTAAGLVLPAEVRPLLEAPIYSRGNGYLKRWLVDIGAHVEAGHLLAEIDTPELDQQLDQARAQLAESEAALALAKTTAERWADLLKTASVSEQENAEKQADYKLKSATVEAGRANVHRLEELQSFERITAPFAGHDHCTQYRYRRPDYGGERHGIIPPGADADVTRVRPRPAERRPRHRDRPIGGTIDSRDTRGRSFPATVTSTSEAMSTDSRTLLTELQVDNSQGEILPGSYAQVRFLDSKVNTALMLPSNTLLFRAEGLQVGVVGPDDKVDLRSVSIGRDFGQTVEVLAGVGPTDRVVVNPADSLVSGTTVRIAEASPAAKAP